MRKAGSGGSRIYLMILFYKEKHKMAVESLLRLLDESGQKFTGILAEK